MGCNQSKIENEETVRRAKMRKAEMKDAVAARNAFAASHAQYLTCLRNTGAALNDFGQGETTDARPAPVLPVPPSVLPPPKPFDEYDASEHLSSRIPRSTSLPVLSQKPNPNPNPDPDPNANDKGRDSAAAAAASSSVGRDHEDEDDDDDDEEHDHDHDHHDHDIDDDEEDEEDEEEEEEDEERSRLRRFSAKATETVTTTTSTTTGVDSSVSDASAARAMPGEWEFFREIQQPPYSHYENQEREIQQEKEQEEKQQQQSSSSAAAAAAAAAAGSAEASARNPATKQPSKVSSAADQHHHNHHHHERARSSVEKNQNVNMQLSLAGDFGKGKKGSGVDILKCLQELDDRFLDASQSGAEVSRMLEANRLHYHSNFADNRGLIDHSKHVMRVITWNSSFKNSHASDEGNHKTEGQERETHAAVLDKLLAWEKKLYDEVKAGELMKIEYRKKITLLNRQKKRKTNPETLEKTKAAVKYLHTRYVVDFQAMDSTSAEIQNLRDEHLYPNLVDLVTGLAKMWAAMHDCHSRQEEIAKKIQININAPEETTEQHYKRTVQLFNVVNEWGNSSSRMISNQKAYISALQKWLRSNLIPIESNLRENVSSPPKSSSPPIQELIDAWDSKLDQLADSIAQEAIKAFASTIEKILNTQKKEMLLKDRAEEARQDYERKSRALTEWQQKYIAKRGPEESDNMETEGNNRDPLLERKLMVEQLHKTVLELQEQHKKACKETRSNSLKYLHVGLVSVFHNMVRFSNDCSQIYAEVKNTTAKYKTVEREE